MADEELRAGAVGVLAPGHGNGAPGVGQRIFHAVGRKLALDGVLRAAGAVAVGVAALHHETGDDAVEGQAIVKPIIGQIHKVLYGNGGGVAVQLHGDGAVVLNVDLRVVGAHARRLSRRLVGLAVGDGVRIGLAAGGQAQQQHGSHASSQ